jgi:hypothetical protein
VKVTGTLASRLWPASVTTAMKDLGSGWFTALICALPESTTISEELPCVPVAVKTAVPS